MSKISIKNLDLYYGDFKALKNINLEIEENKSAFSVHLKTFILCLPHWKTILNAAALF